MDNILQIYNPMKINIQSQENINNQITTKLKSFSEIFEVNFK